VYVNRSLYLFKVYGGMLTASIAVSEKEVIEDLASLVAQKYNFVFQIGSPEEEILMVRYT